MPASLKQRFESTMKARAFRKAAKAGDNETIVKILNEFPAVINGKELFFNLSGLAHAAVNGHTETVRLLLSRGAEIEGRNDLGLTALMFAAAYGHEETVRLLLEKGANINAVNDHGMTPLISATLTERLEMVQLLLDKGADFTIKSKKGTTAAVYARAKYGENNDVVKLLERRQRAARAKKKPQSSPKR